MADDRLDLTDGPYGLRNEASAELVVLTDRPKAVPVHLG